jgi:O-antigen/teichoic acid export membrane protein
MNSSTPSVQKNIFFATLANIFFALTQWGIVVVLTRIGTPEDVGTLTVLTALVTPIFMLANMDMRNGHSADDLTDFTPTDYVALRLLSSFLAVLLVLLLALTYFAESGFLIQVSAVAYALVKFIGAQINMNHGFFQRAERMDYVARSLFCQGAFGLCLFTVAYYYSKSLPVAFFAEAVAWSLSLLIIDRRLLRGLGRAVPVSDTLNVSGKTLLQLARWTIPLGLAVFMMTAASSWPRLVLERHVDISLLGVFGAIAYINIALNIVGNAIGSSSSARLRRLYRDGKKSRFLKLTLLLASLSGLLGGVLCLFVYLYGGEVLTFMYGEFYANTEVFEITIIAAAIRFVAAPMQFSINAGQAFRRRMFNSTTVLIVSIFASMILIPENGLLGAAWAMVTLSVVNLLLTLAAFFVVFNKINKLDKGSVSQ